MTIDEIKQEAGRIGSEYLTRGRGMTDAVYAIAREKKLNPEQIRRLCEIANQNTYLELFQDKSKRGNIVFDTAKSEDIIKSVEEHAVNELDYKLAPEDFRKTAQLQAETGDTATTMTADTDNDLSASELAEKRMQAYVAKEKVKAMKGSVKTMAADEKAAVEEAVDKIAEFAVEICANGEGFADMAKLALRHAHAQGYDLNQNVVALDKVAGFVRGRGFTVSSELTKVSEMNIDPSFKLFKAVDEFNMAMQKLSALNEMAANVDLVLDRLQENSKPVTVLEAAVAK